MNIYESPQRISVVTEMPEAGELVVQITAEGLGGQRGKARDVELCFATPWLAMHALRELADAVEAAMRP